MLVIVPNVMGMCLWSPRIDEVGNSVRGTEFCFELDKKYLFHRSVTIYAKSLSDENLTQENKN